MALPALGERTERLGRSAADLARVLTFLEQQAEVHVHFDPELRLPSGTRVIESLLADGVYRNQFETGVTKGSRQVVGGPRDEWERQLFGGAYHQPTCAPGERPRYGVLNALGPCTPAALHYGSCVLVLRWEVKERVTVTPADSGRCLPEDVGTPAQLAHVLASERMPLAHLGAIFDFVIDGRSYGFAQVWQFLEAQIHGPLVLEDDVAQVLCAPHYRHGATGYHLAKFSAQYGLPVSFELSTRTRGEPRGVGPA